MGWLTLPMSHPGYSGRIPRSAATLPRLLRDSGYNTLAVGKWHLTPTPELSAAGPFDRWPLGLGFERFYGFLDGLTDQWTPDLVVDNGFINQPQSVEEGYHLSEDLATQAIRLVQDQQQAASDKPFFLYFATGAMHWPHHVPEGWIESYGGQFDDGWESLRQRNFDRQQKLGVVPPTAALTARPSWVADWGELPTDARQLFARQMEVYAGFMTHTDAQIGRLLDFLDRTGIADNTVVLILSDNGASADGGPNGAIDNLGMFQANDIATMASRIDALGGPRAYNHSAWGWAWAGNAPFRLWKHYTWLGGVRTPLVIRWPSGIAAAAAGEVRRRFCHAIDLMPTILDVARVDEPAGVDGHSQLPLDGRSIRATMDDGEATAPRHTQYFEMMGSRAIYHDGWKATTNHVAGLPAERELIEGSDDYDTDEWSLFNTNDDFSEEHDLAAAQPERLRRMIELWWYEAGRNQVLPLMDDLAGRIAATESEPSASRQEHIYLPGGGPIRIPNLYANRLRITVNFQVPDDHTPEGVLCAQGNWHGGWALYVLDRQLIAAISLHGSTHRLVAEDVAWGGRHEVTLAFAPDHQSQEQTSVTMELDGHEAASQTVPESAPMLYQLGQTLLVGRDHGLPVSADYEPPFPFTASIAHARLEIPQKDAATPHMAATAEVGRD